MRQLIGLHSDRLRGTVVLMLFPFLAHHAALFGSISLSVKVSQDKCPIQTSLVPSWIFVYKRSTVRLPLHLLKFIAPTPVVFNLWIATHQQVQSRDESTEDQRFVGAPTIQGAARQRQARHPQTQQFVHSCLRTGDNRPMSILHPRDRGKRGAYFCKYFQNDDATRPSPSPRASSTSPSAFRHN